MVVSEIGEQWSPHTAPAITADMHGTINAASTFTAIAAAIGNMIPNVPQLVPVAKAIKGIGKKAIIECSGNIDINNINRFKGLEIDYVSSGAITHSAKILDLSLKNLRYVDD